MVIVPYVYNDRAESQRRVAGAELMFLGKFLRSRADIEVITEH